MDFRYCGLYHLVPFAETSIACLEHNPMKVAGSSTLMYQVISRYGTKHGAASSVSQCSRSCQISLFHVLIILHLYIYMCVCICVFDQKLTKVIKKNENYETFKSINIKIS